MRLVVDSTDIWLRVARFFYRKACKPMRIEPDGVPGRRSAEAPCSGYEPRKKQMGDWDDCETDGHYLCLGCCHREQDLASGTEPPLVAKVAIE